MQNPEALKLPVVSGPININYPDGVEIIKVKSVNEMLKAVQNNFNNNDIFIGAAAPADFISAQTNQQKIKKNESLTIPLRAAPDIIKEVAANKGKKNCCRFCRRDSKPGRKCK